MDKRFKHNHSGNKIRAKNKLFVNSQFEKSFNRINIGGDVICHDDLDIFRKNVKYAVADIERDASNAIKPNLTISREAIDIINNFYYHKNPYVIGFIECIISYYNEKNLHSKLIDLTRSYKSKISHKLMQQAKQNCDMTITSYVNKIIKRMKLGQWENVKENDIAKFEAIEPAVRFFCDIIEFLTIGNIPNNINNDDYLSAISFDKKIKDYYSYDAENDCYSFVPKANNKTNNFNQKCLAFLFCKYYKLK